MIVVSADSGVGLHDCVRHLLATTLPLELILIDNDSSDGVPQAIERAYQRDERPQGDLQPRQSRLRAGRKSGGKKGPRATSCWCSIPIACCDRGQPAPFARGAGRAAQGRAGRCGGLRRRGCPIRPRGARSAAAALAQQPASGGPAKASTSRATIPDEVVEVEAVSGALMLMRRWIFERMGGFDEGYFLHCEDLDLCRRVRDNGYQVLLAGDVRVLHGKGGSSRHRPVFVSRLQASRHVALVSPARSGRVAIRWWRRRFGSASGAISC